MNIISRPRKKMRKRMNSKGFSSIVGAIFMMLIVWALASAYFVYTMSQNTIYNVAVRERNQLDIDRLSESVKVINVNYSVTANNNVNVAALIQNAGPSSIQFLTIWVYVSNSTWANYNFSKPTPIPATVKGGDTYLLDTTLRINEVRTEGNYYMTACLITARGNRMALPKLAALTNTLVLAQTTEGIGALAMSFQDFVYYTVTGSSPNYFLNPYPNGTSAYYIQNARVNKIAFRVNLTNLDQQERTITLTNGSQLFVIYPSSGGNYMCDHWYIVNVNETSGAIFNTFSSVTLNFNQPKLVYFASSSRGTLIPATSSLTPSQVPNIGAINLALVGQIGSSIFGQNIPFVSIELVS